MKLLRNRAMCPKQIYTVFHALIMSRLMYALPAWGGFVSVEQTNRINALLKRCYRYGYVDKFHCLSDLLNSVDLALFDKMQSKAHCMYPLLPPVRSQLEHLRSRGPDFIPPSSFVILCLFDFM